MTKFKFFCGTFFALIVILSFSVNAADELVYQFQNPPLKFSSRPIWELNGQIVDTKTTEQINLAKTATQWGGFTVVPLFSTLPDFKSDDYMKQYKDILRNAKRQNFKITFYDDQNIPSGYTGGQLSKLNPEAIAQRLYKFDERIKGPKKYLKEIPEGNLMSVVAMNVDTKEIRNLKDFINGNTLNWNVPIGTWQIMIFTCKRDTEGYGGKRNLLDYMNPDSVQTFINLTYERFYKEFPTYFGSTIDMTYSSDIGFFYVENGQAWTSSFNERYIQKYNEDPELLYPALWYDIGDNTKAIRAKLFGFRAELLSTGFPMIVNKWASSHNLLTAGNPLSLQSIVPTGISGDQMKFYKYIDIPIISEMNYPGYSKQYYKLISSASYNYDKKLTGVNIFEDYNAIDKKIIYRSIMDAYSRGINYTMPNAIAYDLNNSTTKSEFSSKNQIIGQEMALFNEYINRMNLILQGGRHVADIGVLYPIESLHSFYNMDYPLNKNSAAVSRDEIQYADYLDVGEWLYSDAQCDFTFIHPETFKDKCTVKGNTIELSNEVNFEKYKVFVMPGCEVISVDTLNKIKEFYVNGGKVISTTLLPTKAAEIGKDSEVVKLVKDIFGIDPNNINIKEGNYSENTNTRGGYACFIKTYSYGNISYKKNPDILKIIIGKMLAVKDVSFENYLPLIGGNVSYIHKVLDNRDYYLFNNTSTEIFDQYVLLKGKFKPQIWDPHTGEIYAPQFNNVKVKGEDVTRVKLSIKSLRSLFIVSVGDNDPKDKTINLLLEEKFANLKDWMSTSHAKIVSNGVEVTNTKVMLYNKSKEWSDFSLSFDITMNKNGTAGIIFRATDDENYYLWKFDGIMLYQCKVINGNETIIKQIPVEILQGSSYRFKIIADGSIISVYLAGKLIDSINDMTYIKGTIGLHSTESTTFGNLTVLAKMQIIIPLLNTREVIAIAVGIMALNRIFYTLSVTSRQKRRN